MNLVLMGPPGAGKGSQAGRLIAQFGFAYLSTGDLFRDAISLDNAVGRLARQVLRAGALMPDHVATDLALHWLQQNCAHDVLIDGYPRTIVQAEALDAFLLARGQAVDLVVWLDVPRHLLIERIAGRVVDSVTGRIYHTKSDPPPSGLTVTRRIDDSAEAAIERLDDYVVRTAPVFAHYAARGVASRIDAEGAFEEVSGRIVALIDENRAMSARCAYPSDRA